MKFRHYESTILCSVLLLVCVVPLSGAPKSKRKGKTTPLLSKAILDAQRLCVNLEKANKGARDTIDRSEVLKRKFSTKVAIKDIAYKKDGSLTLSGVIVVMHPDRSRYRTRDERLRIERANDIIKQLKDEKGHRLSDSKRLFRIAWSGKGKGS